MKTVLLETEWVLRHAYEIVRSNIIIEFQKLLGLPNVNVEDPDSTYQTISWYENKFDFADALQLSSSIQADEFVTFDRAFTKKARNINLIAKVEDAPDSRRPRAKL